MKKNERKKVKPKETDGAIVETAYLASVKGMTESILAARKEPFNESSKEAGW